MLMITELRSVASGVPKPVFTRKKILEVSLEQSKGMDSLPAIVVHSQELREEETTGQPEVLPIVSRPRRRAAESLAAQGCCSGRSVCIAGGGTPAR